MSENAGMKKRTTRRWGLLPLAILFFSAAFAAEPAHDPAEDLVRAGHFKQARQLLESRTGDDARTLYWKARVRYAFGDYEGALPLAAKSVTLDGGSGDSHLLLGQIHGQIANKAHLFQQIKLVKVVKREFETAQALDPENLEVLIASAEFYARAPGFVGGDKKKAARNAEEILRLNPARGYLAQAIVARHLQQFDRLRELYTKAGEAGNDYEALSAAADFFLASPADYRKVEDYARRAIQIDSSRGAAYAPLAAALVHQAKWTDLEALLAEADRSCGDDLRAFYAAGKALLEDQRDLPRAETYLRRYLQQEPEAMAPTLAEAHTAQASVLSKEGQKANALAELRDALRSNPNFEPAARELKHLEKE